MSRATAPLMNDVAPPPTRAPAGSIGQVRVFCARIEEADAVMLRGLCETAGAITERRRRSPIPTADTLRASRSLLRLPPLPRLNGVG